MAIEETGLGPSAGVFVLLAIAETAWPHRADAREPRRWIANFGLLLLNTGILRLVSFLSRALAVAAAYGAQHRPWSLLTLPRISGGRAFIIGFVVLDLAVYGQHVAMPAVPVLWRVHRVHHADPAFDLTTGLRFQPLEILLSQVWKIGVIVLIELPLGVDRWPRLAVVTPDMHRVHHSVGRDEHGTNCGFNLALWDRLFATYRADARAPQETMPIGLGVAPLSDAGNFFGLLRFSFVRDAR